jgi:hypothetical protein
MARDEAGAYLAAPMDCSSTRDFHEALGADGMGASAGNASGGLAHSSGSSTTRP